MPDPQKYLEEFWSWLHFWFQHPLTQVALCSLILLVAYSVIKFRLERSKAFNQIKLKKGKINFSHESLSSHSLTLAASRSGKTVNILYSLVLQSFRENNAGFIYDYKFPDLARYTYNVSLARKNQKIKNIYVNFHDPWRSHRVNPLVGLKSPSEAVQLAKTIVANFGNAQTEQSYWAKCAVGLLSASLCFFSKYQGGRHCNLPTVIEFLTATTDRERLIGILSSDADSKILASSIISAVESPETIASQISTVQADLAVYANDEIYWILSANSPGFDGFDLNNPENPVRLICGNNPQAPDYSSPLVSLLAEMSLLQMVREQRLKSSFLLDEAGTFCIPSLPSRIATVAGYGINMNLACQDFAQLQHRYGRENAQAMRGSLSTKLYGKISEGLHEIADSFGEVEKKNISYSYNSRGERSKNVSITREPAVRREFLSELQPGEFIIQDKAGRRFKQKFMYEATEQIELPILTYVTKRMLEDNRKKIAQQVAAIEFIS